jgi:ribonuclease G
MSKELVIGSNRHETKVALLEDDQLVEIFFQRANEYSLAGSIHKGRVTRVLPGMQSAFVDLGLERDTFLYVSDFFEEHPDIDTLPDDWGKTPRGDGRRDRPTERERQAEGPKAGVTKEETSTPPGEMSASPLVSPEVPAETSTEMRDRRSRRSRRRRTRGRGFPENKYAQPPVSSEKQQGAVIAEQEEDDGESDTGDVLILPGESLAKYKQAASHATELAADETEEGEDEAETTTSSGAELEEGSEFAEAESAPLPDGSDVSVEDTTSQRDVRYNDFAIHVVSNLDEEAIDAAQARAEEAAEFLESRMSAIDVEGEVQPSEPKTEFHFEEAEDSDRSVTPIDAKSRAFSELEADDKSGTGAPGFDVEPSSPEAISTEGERAEPADATVREQSGRYMHRMSRRMRRRRGRFNQPAADVGESAGAGVAVAAASEAQPISDTQPDRSERETKTDRLPSITDLLKPGQEIIVQIAKEPLGQKGARITSHVALPGRFVVYMPSVEHLGVSRKISSDEERYRLKRILQAHRVGTTGGFIVRTAGEGRSEDEIAADMNILYNLWLDIRQKAEKKPAPTLLHHDLDVVQRILRDQLTDEHKAVWVDDEEMYENVLRFVQRFQPARVNRVKMYTRSAPIFDAFGITQELEKALRPKVWLKSGGYIVINQTEALVAIDVNTGKFVGKSNKLEDTIVKTNTEAVKEIVRQIRLRDLGGIIVVDFIDMDERKNRQKVMQALEEAMRADKAPYKILQFNDFGLVAITRKRVKQSLERTLCAPCPYCEGAGYVKSVQTIIGEILVEAQKIAAAIEGKDVVLRCHPDIAKVLKSSSNQYLEELEEILGRPVLVTGDAALHHEKFDLA